MLQSETTKRTGRRGSRAGKNIAATSSETTEEQTRKFPPPILPKFNYKLLCASEMASSSSSINYHQQQSALQSPNNETRNPVQLTSLPQTIGILKSGDILLNFLTAETIQFAGRTFKIGDGILVGTTAPQNDNTSYEKHIYTTTEPSDWICGKIRAFCSATRISSEGQPESSVVFLARWLHAFDRCKIEDILADDDSKNSDDHQTADIHLPLVESVEQQRGLIDSYPFPFQCIERVVDIKFTPTDLHLPQQQQQQQSPPPTIMSAVAANERTETEMAAANLLLKVHQLLNPEIQ